MTVKDAVQIGKFLSYIEAWRNTRDSSDGDPLAGAHLAPLAGQGIDAEVCGLPDTGTGA